MEGNEADRTDTVLALVLALLPEIARHHPGILERVELRLTNKIDGHMPTEVPHLVNARAEVRRLLR